LEAATARPFLPVRFRVVQSLVGSKGFRNGEMRWPIAHNKGHAIAFTDDEFTDGGEVFAAQMHRRAQHHHVGPGDRA